MRRGAPRRGRDYSPPASRTDGLVPGRSRSLRGVETAVRHPAAAVDVRVVADVAERAAERQLHGEWTAALARVDEIKELIDRALVVVPVFGRCGVLPHAACHD